MTVNLRLHTFVKTELHTFPGRAVPTAAFRASDLLAKVESNCRGSGPACPRKQDQPESRDRATCKAGHARNRACAATTPGSDGCPKTPAPASLFRQGVVVLRDGFAAPSQ